MIFIKLGHLNFIKIAVDCGPDINHKNEKNDMNSPYAASIFGHEFVAKLLINLGADLNSQNSKNQTPLHLSSLTGQIEITRILIEKMPI